jgi:hypothetical protein
MATIVQRALNNVNEEGSLGISEEEKQQLLEAVQNFQDNKDKK